MTPQRRNLLLLGAVGALAATAGFVAGPILLQSGSGAAQLLSTSFMDLDGRARTLREWSGRILVCNFWATWCPPCVEEIPILVRLHDSMREKNVEVVGIALDSAANVREFAAKTQITYQILLADSSGIDLLRTLGNSAGGLPYTVILDGSGALRFRKLGAFKSIAELEAAVKA